MKTPAALFAVLMLAGCSWLGPQEAGHGTLQFEKGATTRSEVVVKFGQPNETSWLPDGTIIDVYRFVPVGDTSPRTRVLTITFDRSGKLLSYSSVGS